MAAAQIQSKQKDIVISKGNAVSDTFLTLSEYLEREELSSVKHEFHNGKLREMPEGTPPHAQIGGNFGTFLNISLYKKKAVL